MRSNVLRRQLLGLLGVSALPGCAALSPGGKGPKLPILMGVEMVNDTDQSRTIHVRVKRAPRLDAEPQTVFSTQTTLDAHETVTIDGWEKTPGHYALEYRTEPLAWAQSDISARLAERDNRICYKRQIEFDTGGASTQLQATTMTNVDAPCPSE